MMVTKPDIYRGGDSDEWETPTDLYRVLEDEFIFEFDAAASPENAKCANYWTRDMDGLEQDWAAAYRVWCNPPYSNPAPWLAKAAHEARRGALAVLLVPSVTGSRYWWQHVYPEAHEIRFLPGRLRFLCNGRPAGTARFESAIVVYRPGPRPRWPLVTPWDWREVPA